MPPKLAEWPINNYNTFAHCKHSIRGDLLTRPSQSNRVRLRLQVGSLILKRTLVGQARGSVTHCFRYLKWLGTEFICLPSDTYQEILDAVAL